MASRLREEHGVNVSVSTIDREICEFRYTLKRISLILEKRNEESNIAERFQCANTLFLILVEQDGENIVFIVEVGFNISMRAKRGRSPSGAPAALTVQGIRNRNISLCCSMTKNGPVFYRKQDHPFNKQSYATFLEGLGDELSAKQISNALFVMDNVAFHKSVEIRNLIISKRHRVLFLPPYSPFLTPIENMFSRWKENVRRENPQNEP